MKNFTKSELVEFMHSTIQKTYYEYWNLDEEKYPIMDHTVFITYRIFNFYMPKEPLTAGFRRWTREMIKTLAIQHGDRNWVYSRQPVGMYAMDYDGTRTGKLVDGRVGAHVHALWVLHPEIEESIEWQLEIKQTENMTLRKRKKDKLHLNHQEFEPVYKFFWAPYKKKRPINYTIGYNLKGVMHKNGYYPGRGDQWDLNYVDLNKPFSTHCLNKTSGVLEI
jgi:hypothetical protein